MRRGQTAGALVTMALAASALFACATPPDEGLRKAAAFKLPRLTGSDSLSLSDLEGQYVLMNFWASWCGPCRDEIPALLNLHRRFAGTGLTLVGVTVNDRPEDSRGFAREYGLSYLNVIGNTEFYDAYSLTPWIPVTMLISPGGMIVKQWVGPQTEAALLEGIRQAAPDLEAARGVDETTDSTDSTAT